MKTIDLNRKTNGQANVKVYFQRFMMLMVTIMVSTALVGCGILNDDDDPDDNNGGKNNVGKLGGTVWSQHPDLTDYWYGRMDGIEKLIPRDRSYNNSWIFNPNGTFVFTMRWLYIDNGFTYGGVLVCHGNYNVISDSQFKTSNVKANSTTGIYYGNLTGWQGNSGFTCDYQFFTDPAAGNGIKINIHATANGNEHIEFDTWRNFWTRSY
jgi:hypothetical protein